MTDGKKMTIALAAALGPKWSVVCDPNMWRRWRLMRDGYDYCCARRAGDLLRVFVKRTRDGVRRNPMWYARLYRIPEFLRCGSVEELRLKLEALYV